ncbi:hypothetical protein QCE47_19195 [Caballeronia sp. LZ025]|uniref:hypothetical protein n=1 Tax=Caballeronia TaxID=1827195 RepID=UPI001FD5184D|nr:MULTISPECIES: hypothetical protein [Caballeronia]MDR5734437.1 hypothetical protein [Caballeronia sp. LZ025]
MTPVDVLARALCALCALALHPREGLHVANLHNPECMSQDAWFEALGKEGLRALPEAPEAWKRRLATLDSANGLALLRDFYTGDLHLPRQACRSDRDHRAARAVRCAFRNRLCATDKGLRALSA